MRIVLAVLVLPLAATWLVSAIGLWVTAPASSTHVWLERYRWWLLWPALAVYAGAVGTWLLAPVFLAVGAVLFRFEVLGLLQYPGPREPGPRRIRRR